MIQWLIDISLRNRFLVIAGSCCWEAGAIALRTTIRRHSRPLGQPGIVFTTQPGRSPQEVEDQITYPLTVGLQGLPGVRVVRSSSAFGFSMTSFLKTPSIFIARTRVLERLNLLNKALPSGVVNLARMPRGGTSSGTPSRARYARRDLRALRTVYPLSTQPLRRGRSGQRWGAVRQYQIDVDPNAPARLPYPSRRSSTRDVQ